MAQNSNTNNAPEHTSFSRAARPWAQMSLFKQRGAGRENKNCVGLKPYTVKEAETSKNPYAALRRVYDRVPYIRKSCL